jgi:oxalate decarboxylase/phosphoglucose isomerase-like protein (cupin superfamily)
MQVAAAPLKPPSPYVHRMGQQEWLEYPGGKYKASTTSDLPTTTIAGAVFQLNAGALRELHWHDATEWAIVLNGTCRWVVGFGQGVQANASAAYRCNSRSPG